MHENCLNSIFFNSYKLNIFFLQNRQKIGYLKKSRIALKIKELECFKIRCLAVAVGGVRTARVAKELSKVVQLES